MAARSTIRNALVYTVHDEPHKITQELRDLRVVLERIISRQDAIIDVLQDLQTQLFEQSLIESVKPIQ